MSAHPTCCRIAVSTFMLTLYQIYIYSAKRSQISIGIVSRSATRYMIFSDGGSTKASMASEYVLFISNIISSQ